MFEQGILSTILANRDAEFPKSFKKSKKCDENRITYRCYSLYIIQVLNLDLTEMFCHIYGVI